MIAGEKTRCVIVFGTRPEAIKLAPVAHALLESPKFETVLVNSGQHDVLMPSIMSFFGVSIDHQLRAITDRQDLASLTERLIAGIASLLREIKPGVVMVQGDTATAMAGALCAFSLGITVAHVEAGLRTSNLLSPYPEEGYRRIVSSVASWHFCPSEHSAKNLRSEGVYGQIAVTGNPVVDALNRIQSSLAATTGSTLKRVVATIHRRENFSHLEGIFSAFRKIASDPAVEFLFPVHANPNVRSAVDRWLTGSPVKLIEPLDYLPWIELLRTADLIISDSGGIQEEASVLGVPLLVTRNNTERPEVVDGGYARLVGVDEDAIVKAARAVLEGRLSFKQGSPYGDGAAAIEIVRLLHEWAD